MIESIDRLDLLGKELTGFLCHWRTISTENSQDFIPKVYSEHESLKKQLPFLKKLHQILRGNDYSQRFNYYFEFELPQRLDGQIYMLSREKASDELKKENPTLNPTNEIESIEKSISNQSEMIDLEIKFKNFSIAERKEFFLKTFFPATDKKPHWSEILRVTECEHCPHYRYFFFIHSYIIL